jgi:outer membrane protein OmpA-like peptidoglycan-associated protein
MASKKYSLLTGVLCLLASYGFSQVTYDPMDSSIVRSKDMEQYTKFKQGIENYPAKPRNQWELGIKTGLFNINGDVHSQFFTVPNVGIHLRKAFGYIFSARLEYVHGTAKGLNWEKSQGYVGKGGGPDANPWANAGYTQPVFYNYKTQVNDLSLEGIFSLNNIRFHKSKTGVNFYALIGGGAAIYDAKVNAKNGSSGTYETAFAGIQNGSWKTRKDTKDAIKNVLDDSYETAAENFGDRRPKLFGQTLRPVMHVGAGVAFKLSNRINLAIEDRYTITNDDLLDGQRWAEQPGPGTAVLTSNWDTYNFASVGLNFNLGSKAVEPLWWQNPLDYAYQEIRKPKYMILPKPVLPDADGDGVTDQFDQEQTPQGCPVDSHGVSLDTDGDGVPDCRDKEKITPTMCQPVDADGVGKCPVQCPDSTCPGWVGKSQCDQALGALPSVSFTSDRSTTLTSDAQSLLASIAARLRNSPECKVVVTSYCSSTKAQQQRAWDRVNVIIKYMVEKEGISGDRFYWQIGQEGGDCNTVDFRAATDQDAGLPTTVPNPNLGRGK